MRYWLALMYEPTEQFVDLAVTAEELGYEGIAMADHLIIPDGFASVHPSGEKMELESSAFPEPFVMSAAMATATTRLRFLSYVYVLPMREPFSVAKQVGTASLVSGGRVVMGVGAGWLREEFDALGRDPTTRGRRMDEMLDVIADFWDDGWAEHHGEFFDFPRSSMLPVPTAMYSGAKAALMSLTRSMAGAFAGRGIRVNALAPGSVDTDMMRNNAPEAVERMGNASLMRRIASPAEMVGPALFLASDASSFMTGQVLLVDGGLAPH